MGLSWVRKISRPPNLFLASDSAHRQSRYLFSSHSTDTFSSITIYGTRRFARAEARRCLVRFDRVRSRWLAWNSTGRGRPLAPSIAPRHFLRDFREQLILHGSPLRIVHNIADGEFERSGAY